MCKSRKDYQIPYPEAKQQSELWKKETNTINIPFELKQAHVFDIEAIKQLIEIHDSQGKSITHMRFYHGVKEQDGKMIQALYAVGAIEDPVTGHVNDVILSESGPNSGMVNFSRPCPPWCNDRNPNTVED